MPCKDQPGPDTAEEPEEAGPGVAVGGGGGAAGIGEGGEEGGVGALASAGEEEGHEGDAVAEGVVDAENGDGCGVGGGDVEDVEVPEWPGGVHGGAGEGGHVVLHHLVRVRGAVAWIQVRDDNVVFQVYPGPDPSQLLLLRDLSTIPRLLPLFI